MSYKNSISTLFIYFLVSFHFISADQDAHWVPAKKLPLDNASLIDAPENLEDLKKTLGQRTPPVSAIDPALSANTVTKIFSSLAFKGQTKVTPVELQKQFLFLKLNHGQKCHLTGYYTPVFKASLTPDDIYRFPLYKEPTDLSKKNLKYDRISIDDKGVLKNKGLEIAWLKDKLDVYLVHVQGSATLQLADQKKIQVAYVSSNRLPYHSLGKSLVADKKIRQEDISLFSIRKYFRQHPNDLNHYLYKNKRYIFFKVSSQKPTGSMATQVFPMHSFASEKLADGRYLYPPYIPMLFVFDSKTNPTGQKSILALNLDTGAAIKGLQRFDLYTGHDAVAEKTAGLLNHKVDHFVLWPKSQPLPKVLAGKKVVIENSPENL